MKRRLYVHTRKGKRKSGILFEKALRAYKVNVTCKGVKQKSEKVLLRIFMLIRGVFKS